MLSNPPSSPFGKGGVISLSILILLILTATPPSAHSAHLYKYHQIAMGTVVEITLVGEDEEAVQKAVLQGFQEIKRIENLMSPWIESSDVARINRSAGKEWVKVSPETVVRDWKMAKAWLGRELSGGKPDES